MRTTYLLLWHAWTLASIGTKWICLLFNDKETMQCSTMSIYGTERLKSRQQELIMPVSWRFQSYVSVLELNVQHCTILYAM